MCRNDVHWSPWFPHTWQHAPESRIACSGPHVSRYSHQVSCVAPLLHTETDQVAAARGAARRQCLAGLERERMASIMAMVCVYISRIYRSGLPGGGREEGKKKKVGRWYLRGIKENGTGINMELGHLKVFWLGPGMGDSESRRYARFSLGCCAASGSIAS